MMLDDGEGMLRQELEEAGLNQAKMHVDVMFGSPEVEVLATVTREGEVVLLEGGQWHERFLAPPPR